MQTVRPRARRIRRATIGLLQPFLFAVLVPAAVAQTKLYDVEPPTPIDNGVFGFDAISVGDRNSDGVPDFSVTDQTGVHIFDGVDGDLLFTITGPPDSSGFGFGSQGTFGTPVGLIRNQTSDVLAIGASGANMLGRAFTFNGAGQLAFAFDSPGGGEFGTAVVDAGDPDGDGFHRIGIGAASGEGVVYFYDSFTGMLTDSLKSPDPHDGSLFGLVIRNMGDLNNDGVDELLVSAPTDVVSGFNGAGRAFVFNGATLQFIYALESPNPEESGVFGAAIDNIGDVDDDGAADIAVSAFREDAGGNDAGRVYVFSGADGTPLFDVFSPNPQANGWFGRSVTGVGDVDGDGLPDIAVAAANENNQAGRVYLFTGDDQYITTIEPDEADGDTILFGIDLAAVGDVNGDGRSDLFIGAPLFDRGAIQDAGAGSVWSYMEGGVANEQEPTLLAGTVLHPTYPNPMGRVATIRFDVPASTHVRLSVYDTLGREIAVLRDAHLAAGSYDNTWNAGSFADGVYFFRLSAGNVVRTSSVTRIIKSP